MPTSFFEAAHGEILSEIEEEAALWLLVFYSELEKIDQDYPDDVPSKERDDLINGAKNKVWECFWNDVRRSESRSMAALAKAIDVLREAPRNGKVRMGYLVAFLIAKELDEGKRQHPPTTAEFLLELEKFGAPEPDAGNARKLAKQAGWTPTKGKPGRPRKMS